MTTVYNSTSIQYKYRCAYQQASLDLKNEEALKPRTRFSEALPGPVAPFHHQCLLLAGAERAHALRKMFAATRTAVMAALTVIGVQGVALQGATGAAGTAMTSETGAQGRQAATMSAGGEPNTNMHSMPACMRCGSERPKDCEEAVRMIDVGCASSCPPGTKQMLKDMLVSGGVCGPQVAERQCGDVCRPNCKEEEDMHKPACAECLTCRLKSTNIEYLESKIVGKELGVDDMTGSTGYTGSAGTGAEMPCLGPWQV